MARRRQAGRWALVGLAVHLLLTGALLVAQDGNPQWFVHFGREGWAVPLAKEKLGEDVLIPHADGHDGRWFWVLARDPLLFDADTIRTHVDRPAYRAQRVTYPLLAAPWRLGGEHALPWGLLVTNLAAVALGGYAAALLAVELGAPARASLAFALNPATLAGVIIDGSDAVALAGLLASLLFVVRRRPVAAIAFAVVATLAKEPSLFALAGVALLAPGLTRRFRVALVAVPAAAALVWALYARWRLGWPPSQIQEFAAPFWGYVESYRRGWRPVGNWGDAAVALALLPFAVAVVMRWRARGGLLLAGAVPFAVLVPFLSAQVLNLPGNALRAVGPAVTFLWLSAYVPAGRSEPASAAAASP